MTCQREGDRPCTSAAAAAARQAARQVCIGTPIEEALLSVRLRPEAAAETARSLADLGLLDVLDLQLLAGGPEAHELLTELKAAGMTVGDRAKLRLLVGDRAHASRLSVPFVPVVAAPADPQQHQQHHHQHQHQQQHQHQHQHHQQRQPGQVAAAAAGAAGMSAGAPSWTPSATAAAWTPPGA